MKRKWLKVLMLAMMTGASFGSPMNPKEIEDLMYIVNQTRIEFTVPHEDDNGQGGKKGANQETMNHLLSNHAASEMYQTMQQAKCLFPLELVGREREGAPSKWQRPPHACH